MEEVLVAATETSFGWGDLFLGFLVFIGGALTAWLTYLGQKATARSQKQQKEIEVNTPHWKAFVEEIKEFYGDQVETMKKEMECLRSDVSSLREDMSFIKRRYFSALEWIKNVIAHNDEIVNKHKLPEDILDDLKLEK